MGCIASLISFGVITNECNDAMLCCCVVYLLNKRLAFI